MQKIILSSHKLLPPGLYYPIVGMTTEAEAIAEFRHNHPTVEPGRVYEILGEFWIAKTEKEAEG